MNQSPKPIFHEYPLLRLLRHGSAALIMCSSAGWLPAEDRKWQEQVPMPDKSRYHLFDPTPRDQMREMSTDRPDQTESAYTVDAGHFQVEMDFASAGFDRDRSGGGDMRTTVWGVTPLNLKVGLLNNVDAQFMLDPDVHSRVEDRVAGTVDKASGFGDLQTRLKINLWGNDGGKTALAIMPFVKWPLPASGLRNGKTEGGVIISRWPSNCPAAGAWA